MKTTLIFLSVILLNNIMAFSQQIDQKTTEFLLIEDSYLGQKPPGLKPEIFAKDILNKYCTVYANAIFNNEFSKVYWTPNSCADTVWKGGIYVCKKENDKWIEFKEIWFLDENYNHRSPFCSYNSNRIYFQGHLKENKGWDQQERFYYVDKVNDTWSEPKILDTIFNKFSIHWQFSVDKEQNIYFGGDLRGVENSGGIYYSKYRSGTYDKPVLIFNNSKYGDAVFGPAISPDNKYVLFARIHPRGSTNPRIFSIYISFRKGELDWTEPKELGELLNMDGNQPRISPDGKYIFFVGNDGYSYWVDSKIIDELKSNK